MAAIDAARDCCEGLAAGLTVDIIEDPIDALLLISCLNLDPGTVGGALAVCGLTAVAVEALGVSGRAGLGWPSPAPVPDPGPIPAGRLGATLGGKMAPLLPIRDRGIALLTSTCRCNIIRIIQGSNGCILVK